MIIDSLNNFKRYFSINSRFIEAYEFLQKKDLEQLPTGTYNLKGNELFGIV